MQDDAQVELGGADVAPGYCMRRYAHIILEICLQRIIRDLMRSSQTRRLPGSDTQVLMVRLFG